MCPKIPLNIPSEPLIFQFSHFSEGRSRGWEKEDIAGQKLGTEGFDILVGKTVGQLYSFGVNHCGLPSLIKAEPHLHPRRASNS